MLNGQIILILKHERLFKGPDSVIFYNIRARLQGSPYFLYLSVFRLFASRLQLRFPSLAAIRTFRREFKPVFFKTVLNFFFSFHQASKIRKQHVLSG